MQEHHEGHEAGGGRVWTFWAWLVDFLPVEGRAVYVSYPSPSPSISFSSASQQLDGQL